LSNNYASNNEYGIYLEYSSNITLRNNNASNNEYGIRLWYSSNNKIYLNNFINNTDNVHSYYSKNIWNSPEKIPYIYEGETFTNYLGNYWDDYTGIDANNDGIGDSPYQIDSDKDNYPLMRPFENYPPAPTPEMEWSKIFGGAYSDSGRSVQQTSDGGYIIVGETESFGWWTYNVYLIKTDEKGNEEWSKKFGNAGDDDYGESVQQTDDGGYIIVGSTHSYGTPYDVYLIKTDENGNIEWSKTFGGSDSDYGESVRQTSDGGYIIAGGTSSFGAGSSDVYLIKTDENGNIEWSKTFGGASWDRGYAIQQTSDGGYIIAGSTKSFGAGSSDIYLIKTDENGNMEWRKTFGGSYDEDGHAVQQTSDGGYIIAGSTESFGAGDYDVYLIKTDEKGNEEWSRTFGGSNWDKGYSAQQASDGGYVIAGSTESFGAGYRDVYLIKTDEKGNEEWSKTFGGTDWDHGESVQQTDDGGYIIAGSTESFGAGWGDVYLIKLAPKALTPVYFDTGSPENPYPSISGTHKGTITPNKIIEVSKLYTYPCEGTGGHAEYARIYNESWSIGTLPWEGYGGDWHNLSFTETFKLYANVEYKFTIKTGSYPQIHHTKTLQTQNGWINCTSFVDANGRKYNDWIPAIKLYA
ncbi:hypothetical protein DRJ16_07635, partial [Candidatus Woesearchaeota archaeon]